MTTLKFKCKLLSDVILNQKAATEGPNQTLDFIPGSCFLGIVASELYEKLGMNEKTLELFHSGKVRFGDAHPSQNGVRGLKIPASMFYPKLKKVTDKEIYIHHAVPDLESDEMKQKQLKQCRSGFYTFDSKATEVKTETNFAIKSAYDKEKRRSEDNKMYGYESLQEGLELYFEVQVNTEDLAEKITNALTKGGSKRVGRSRTAQYGLVKIELLPTEQEQEYKDLETTQTITLLKDKDGNDVKCVTVYADGRLIFLDEYGLPTFRPEAKDLGLEGCEILWEKSQIRTFQYAPWNYQRQCFDTDRCGIEKGSVFVVKLPDDVNLNLKSRYIGSYNNEGFGKVIYNPEFLKADGKGMASYQIDKQEDSNNKKLNNEEWKTLVEKEIDNLKKGNVLMQYLAQQKYEEQMESEVYARVNDWVNKNWKQFRGHAFASQWGAIRSIAMKHKELEELKNELFDKTRMETKTKKDGSQEQVRKPNAYLTHGVAADKWNEKKRKELLLQFFDGFDYQEKKYSTLTNENAQMALVNLAAEMAKKCKQEDE